MFHPLMPDLSKMSEKELIEKMGKVQQRIAVAANFGMNQQIIDQLRMTMLVYQSEIVDRVETIDLMGETGCCWDMDKYVEENQNEKVQEQDDTPRWQSFADSEFGDSFFE